MGGRFDATNAVTPKVSVITTISLEHQAYLGDTLSRIAFEKAGIIKPGVPVVCGSRIEEAISMIRKRALERKSSYFGVFDKKNCFQKTKRRDRYTFTYEINGDIYDFSPSLRGEHQGENAAVVIAAAHHLSQCWKKLEKKKIVQALESTQWEGRLEVFSQKPLILLDGAHNEQGMKALRAYLHDFVSSPIALVFAVMRDKKIDELADILFPVIDKIILTSFPYHRAATPAEIKARTSRYSQRITMEPNPNKALSLAVKAAGGKGAIVVAGSLFLVGEIKKGWKPFSISDME
jgi:dihydrofolate synthase/folylpolyglutamate synthase